MNRIGHRSLGTLIAIPILATGLFIAAAPAEAMAAVGDSTLSTGTALAFPPGPGPKLAHQDPGESFVGNGAPIVTIHVGDPGGRARLFLPQRPNLPPQPDT